jgi:hypothetical protein
LSFVKRVAHVPSSDPDALGAYPLDGRQARDIAGAIGVQIDAHRYDFFLEPFAEDSDTSREHRSAVA